MSWDPRQYLSFSGHRLRPALDLIAQIPLEAPKRVVDLGCGPGNVTDILAKRWPDAQVTGIDSSAEMLARARQDFPDYSWQQADAGDWTPEAAPDLIFSNACLHWLPNHDQLFPQLLSCLAPGGILAVQIPRNFSRPTHQMVEKAARSCGLYNELEHMFQPPPTHEPGYYYDCLAPVAADLNLWECDYLQVMEGENPVAEWTKGSWLRPFLAALDATQAQQLEDAYRSLILDAYPKQGDGKTLLPFLRLFLVATRQED